MGTIFLRTDRLDLYTLDENFVTEEYTAWFNSDKVCMYNSHRRYPYMESENVGYVRGLAGRKDLIVLAVVDRESKKHIGNISLQNIDYIDRMAEVAFIFGDYGVWGEGYATEAGEALIRHAFEQLNLHRLYLGTADNNIGMQKVADKLGFHREGIRIDAIYKNGKYHSIIEYGLIRDAV